MDSLTSVRSVLRVMRVWVCVPDKCGKQTKTTKMLFSLFGRRRWVVCVAADMDRTVDMIWFTASQLYWLTHSSLSRCVCACVSLRILCKRFSVCSQCTNEICRKKMNEKEKTKSLIKTMFAWMWFHIEFEYKLFHDKQATWATRSNWRDGTWSLAPSSLPCT